MTEPARSGPEVAVESRVERKRRQKTREIVTAAAQVLNRVGYHAMSLDEVAERVDLTKATLYHYFGGKDELVAACLSLVADEVNERLERLADTTATLSAKERMRTLLADQLTILLIDYPEAGRLFIQPFDWSPEHARLVRRLRQRHDAIFRGVLQSGVASGEFSSADPNIALHCIYGAINYTPVWARPASLEGCRRLIDSTCDILLKMIV